jgi:ABC-type nickel/cobalt efflux system permease component RcnA
MKPAYRFFAILCTLLICFTFVPVAFAHPLGNFTVNHYVGLQLSPDAVTIDYVMDMAEIAAFQEIELLDANGNRQPDSSEAAGYHSTRCASLLPSLRLSLDRKAVTLSLVSSSVEFPPGVGGLPTMRLTCEFLAPVPIPQDTVTLSFYNGVFAGRLGWQEIVVIPNGVSVEGDYSPTSLSSRLTNYPQDLLTSPLEQRNLVLEVTLAGASVQDTSDVIVQETKSSLADRNDAFTRLILLEDITFATILLALAISFVWGAMHALTPGHGKTIVGAYLVGSRGSPKHALYLGLATTLTHTLGVFALGLITLFAAQYIVPETLYPWMSLLSGVFVVGIGIKLFLSRIPSSGIWLSGFKTKGIKHTLIPVLQHHHVDGAGRTHKYILNASMHRHLHLHDHGHPHVHSHDDHAHPHGHEHDGHSHMPPEQITWRSLLALGVSGGLVPCPSALVVMLGAIALNKIGFGLVLVLTFSLGLAATLTAIGMLFLYAGRLFERFPSQGRVLRIVPALSALFVSALGAAIVWKALGEIW